MSNENFAASSLATLRKVALAAVLLGGTALATIPAHATLLASGEGESFRTSDANNAGEGASFRISDVGEGESFRTSDANNAGEGASFRISAGEGETFRTSDASDAGEGESFRVSDAGDYANIPA